MRTKSKSSPYPDLWLRIIAIPSIALFSQHIGLTWEEIRDYVSHDYYFHNILFNTSVTFVLWQLCRALIIYLDQKRPYESGFAKRVVLQIGFSILITVAVGELLSFLYVKVLFQADYWDTHWHTDLPITILFTVLVNFIYVGFYLARRESVGDIPSENAQPQSTVASSPIAMISRKKTVLIPQSEIVLFASQERLTFAYLKDGQRLLVEKTIKQLAVELPEKEFFQANRAQIIQRQFVASHQKTSTRKLLISLHHLVHFQEGISVSKARTPLFLNWLSV